MGFSSEDTREVGKYFLNSLFKEGNPVGRANFSRVPLKQHTCNKIQAYNHPEL